MRSLALLACLTMAYGAGAQGQDDQVVGGRFATDEDKDGFADGWTYWSGTDDAKADVTFGREQLAPGRFAQRVTATRFEGGHVMIGQIGTVAVKAGEWYEIKFRARGEQLGGLNVALHDTNGWKHCGLWRNLSLSKRWRDYAYKFQADHDCHETSRLQFWYTTTGTLWLSDVSLISAMPPPPSNIVAEQGGKNLLPNGGFEIGGGWGTVGAWTDLWNTVPGGVSGNCARVQWEPDKPQWRYAYDYFDMVNRPIERGCLQVIGYMPLQVGETYMLSAWMKADREGAPATIGFRGPGANAAQAVKLTTEWQRFSVPCKATGEKTLVEVGPDFRAKDEAAFGGCQVWIDNAQLERGAEATEFAPRALDVHLYRPIFIALDDLDKGASSIEVMVHAADAPVALRLAVKDFSDEVIGTQKVSCPVKDGVGRVEVRVPFPGPGFYRLNLEASQGAVSTTGSARVTVLPPVPETDDTAFGINHAYPWDVMLQQAQHLGIKWVRDWSLKWEHVEPEKGTWTWDQRDFQINRPVQPGHEGAVHAAVPVGGMVLERAAGSEDSGLPRQPGPAGLCAEGPGGAERVCLPVREALQGCEQGLGGLQRVDLHELFVAQERGVQAGGLRAAAEGGVRGVQTGGPGVQGDGRV